MRSRLPLVAATLAFVASVVLATPVGNAARALVLPKGSVGTAQLKTAAVTAPKVKNGSLTRLDVAKKALVAGPAGPAGATGPGGPLGPPGATGAPGPVNYEIVQVSTVNDATDIKSLNAVCPAGKQVIGGGAHVVGDPDDIGVRVSVPVPAFALWAAEFDEIVLTATPWQGVVYAICARVS
jgi:hypothetical protein